jgi:hypothetical protein
MQHHVLLHDLTFKQPTLNWRPASKPAQVRLARRNQLKANSLIELNAIVAAGRLRAIFGNVSAFGAYLGLMRFREGF